MSIVSKVPGVAAVLALAASIFAGSSFTGASAEPLSHVYKPGRGISLDVGAAKIAGYFLADGGSCRVTLMVGARADADGSIPALTVTRIETRVLGGSNQRVFTHEGQKLHLSCAGGAKLLVVSTERQAYAGLR